ncbi:30S ribosomal protein S5, partial [Omnitrophica bacterium]|nr:30S ribosomal protein S5 [Candidatus Omnitrophota bacterium]
GIKNILTKSLGSNNPVNVVKATLNGLCKMRLVRKRGDDAAE